MKNIQCCIQLLITFFKIGALTFGGGMSMLPMLQKELVETKKWLSQEEIINYFAIGQCTPGIIAINVATFCGCKMAGITGALFSTFGMVLPSWIVITIIAGSIMHFSDYIWVQHAMKGVYVAVAALLFRTVCAFGKKIITGIGTASIAVAAFAAMAIAHIPGFYIVAAAGITGFIIQTLYRHQNR